MTDAVDQTLLKFPIQRTCPYAPPPEYGQLREAASATQVRLPSGARAWVVARYEDVRAVLSNPRFSSDRSHPGFPLLLAGMRPVVADNKPSGQRKISPFSLLSMDPPEHSHARRAVLGEFTLRHLQPLRPRVQQIVADCVDAMLAGPRPADLVAALSLPVPSLVICELLGVPYADHDFFQERAVALLRRTASAEERGRVIGEMWAYPDQLVTRKERQPGDDLIGRQILKRRQSDVQDSADDHEELVRLAFLLLIAGHGTTANMISVGTLALLDNSPIRESIRQDPAKTPGAVEELLRYFTVVETSMSRVALDDMRVGDVLVRAGEGVITLAYAANRDPSAFEDPDHSISTGRLVIISRSVMGRTGASGRTWPGWSCRSSSTPCSSMFHR